MTAVLVLMGWLFSVAVSSAYGCVLYDAAHHVGLIEDHPHTLHGNITAELSAEMPALHTHAGMSGNNDADVCKTSCDLQTSPVVKGSTGQAPDLYLVAVYTSAYIIAAEPPLAHAPEAPGDAEPGTNFPIFLRTTRLTL